MPEEYGLLKVPSILKRPSHAMFADVERPGRSGGVV